MPGCASGRVHARPAATKARAWSHRGVTPVVRTRVRVSGRICMAGLVCCRPGERMRLVYQMIVHLGRRNTEREAFARTASPAPSTRPTSSSAGTSYWYRTTRSSTQHLTGGLPDPSPYAPDLNPAEGVWSHLKCALANMAACGIDALADLTRVRLRKCSTAPASSTASSPKPDSPSIAHDVTPGDGGSEAHEAPSAGSRSWSTTHLPGASPLRTAQPPVPLTSGWDGQLILSAVAMPCCKPHEYQLVRDHDRSRCTRSSWPRHGSWQCLQQAGFQRPGPTTSYPSPACDRPSRRGPPLRATSRSCLARDRLHMPHHPGRRCEFPPLRTPGP